MRFGGSARRHEAARQDGPALQSLWRAAAQWDWYWLCLWAIAALSAVLLVYPFVRMFHDFEINYNEGWNAYLQAQAVSGQGIYHGYSAFFFNNYPPLSFYLIGGLGSLLGDPVLAGRLVSMTALLAITWFVARIVRRAGAQMPEAALAAAAFLLLFLSYHSEYAGMNDPQMLAMAFGVAALSVHMAGSDSRLRPIVTAILVALALLTKHNLLAIPVVILADSAINESRRYLIAYIVTGLILGLMAAAAIWLAEGAAFFTQLLAPRAWSLGRAALLTFQELLRLQATIAVVLVGLLFVNTRAAWVVVGYLMVSLAIGLVFSGGAGTVNNMFFDSLVALAIGTGLVFARLRQMAIPPLVMAGLLLAANGSSLLRAPETLASGLVKVGGGLQASQRAFAEDVRYLAARPGPAFCESLLLCFRAGKLMDVDPFNGFQATATGRLPPDALTARVRSGSFATVQIASLASDSVPNAKSGNVIPALLRDDYLRANLPPFNAALEARYRIDRRSGAGLFWVPSP